MGRLDPYLIQRGPHNRWYICIPAGMGSPTRFIPTRTSDKEEAQMVMDSSGIVDIANAQRLDALTQRVWLKAINGGRVLLPGARNKYICEMTTRGLAPSTIAKAAIVIDSWIRNMRIGKSPVASIRPEHVSAFVNNPSSKTMYSTRCKQLQILGYFFDFCATSGYLPVNPCQSLSVRTSGLTSAQLMQRKKIPFSDAEVATLLAGIPKNTFWHGAVLLGKHFGLRLSTVACLEWASLPELKRISVFTQKGRIVVDQPLPDELQQWFAEWPKEGDAGYCFPRAASMVFGLSVANLSLEFHRICLKNGIHNRSFHCLRVAAVTRELDSQLAQLGGAERALLSSLVAQRGMRAIQRLIGHAEGSMVTGDRYFSPQPPQPAGALQTG